MKGVGGLLHGLDQCVAVDECLYAGHVRRERPVIDERLDVLPDQRMGCRDPWAWPQRFALVDPFRSCEQLDGKAVRDVFDNLAQLTSANASHAYVIFAVGARGNGVDACGVAEHFVFADEGSTRDLRDHEA